MSEQLLTDPATPPPAAVERTARRPGARRLAATAAAALLLAGCGRGGNENSTQATTLPPPAPTAEAPTSGSSPAPSRSAAPRPGGPLHLITEHADNRNGVPVFADTYGSAVEAGRPGRIPYGTAVAVECYAPNESGMSSINFLYKIGRGGWSGDYAPANTFDNGAGMGPNAVDLDPRVLPCPSDDLLEPTALPGAPDGGPGVVLSPTD